MTTRQRIGAYMLALPLLVIFITAAVKHGIPAACLIFLALALLVAFISVGVSLVMGEGPLYLLKSVIADIKSNKEVH